MSKDQLRLAPNSSLKASRRAADDAEEWASDADVDAARDIEELEGDAKRLYEPMGRAVNEAFAKFGSRAIPADRVARAIEHALTARRPKARYLVGTDAKLQAFLARALPDRLRDAVIGRLLGLPRG